MINNELNNISGNLYNLMLYLHTKLHDPNEVFKSLNMPPSHFKVMIYLMRNGTPSISEAAKSLGISKSNMTPIIDKLTNEGFINRYSDPNDRRILRVELTDKASELIKNCEILFKNNLAKKISSLDSKDLESLSNHITGLTAIISKI